MMQMKNIRSNMTLIILCAVGLAFATLPFWGSEYLLFLAFLFLIYLTFAQMWNLLAGYSGLISLGQQAFIGLGGYTMAIMTNYYGYNIWLGVVFGGITSALLALVMSLFIFRMKDVYFAIGTWIFAESLMLWFSNWEYVKFGSGLMVNPENPPDMTTIYYASFLVGVGSVAVVYGMMRSKLGLGLMAMRDDENVAEAMGVEVFWSKFYCFIIGAFVTGTGAGILYIFQVFIQPYKAFSIEWTVLLVFMVIIGGIGTIEGPIVGTFLYILLSQTLSEYMSLSMLIFGGVAIAVILVAPKGIMGTLHDKLGFEILSARRR
ncbi:MAG: branched-chain amino acid ABC transporter permease [Desulfuromusa sp.]|nr:branched-chain amino acid ABC transporter permease [Desulfuromusa sp.]